MWVKWHQGSPDKLSNEYSAQVRVQEHAPQPLASKPPDVSDVFCRRVLIGLWCAACVCGEERHSAKSWRKNSINGKRCVLQMKVQKEYCCEMLGIYDFGVELCSVGFSERSIKDACRLLWKNKVNRINHVAWRAMNFLLC